MDNTSAGVNNRLCGYCGGYHNYSADMCQDMHTNGLVNNRTEIDKLKAELAELKAHHNEELKYAYDEITEYKKLINEGVEITHNMSVGLAEKERKIERLRAELTWEKEINVGLEKDIKALKGQP